MKESRNLFVLQRGIVKVMIKVITSLNRTCENFLLNLPFRSTLWTGLRHNVRRPFLWVGKPRWTLPPQVYTNHASAPTAKICRVFSSGNMSPDNIWLTFFSYPIGNKLSIHTTTLIQWRATVLSNQHCISGSRRNPLRDSRTFAARLTAM